MKNIFNLTVITAVFVLLVLGCGKSGGGSTTSGPAADEKPIAVGAKTLTKEYDENELAADGKYKGKLLAVTGKITDIAETLGNVTVQMEGHNMVVTVMCSFDESQKGAVSRLKKGQTAIMTGTGDGSTGGLYVGLEKCRL